MYLDPAMKFLELLVLAETPVDSRRFIRIKIQALQVGFGSVPSHKSRRVSYTKDTRDSKFGSSDVIGWRDQDSLKIRWRAR